MKFFKKMTDARQGRYLSQKILRSIPGWLKDCRHRRTLKEHCDKFVLSDYGAARNRKHIKLIRDGGKNDGNQDYTK